MLPMARIMAEHGIPYAAVICATYPGFVFDTYRKARGIMGRRYIEMLVPCSNSPGERCKVKLNCNPGGSKDA